MRLRVLVACEFSGRIRDAFLAAGHDAVSCDLLPTESPGPHHVGDATALLADGWDLLIAHPPCTYLANSGVQYLHTRPERWEQMREAAELFNAFLSAPVPHIAVENPTPHRYARELIGRPSQYIQPHDFGTLETKRTGLWLRALPPLLATEDGRGATMARPARDRMPAWWGGDARSGHARSVTAPGIGVAMATQWPDYISERVAS